MKFLTEPLRIVKIIQNTDGRNYLAVQKRNGMLTLVQHKDISSSQKAGRKPQTVQHDSTTAALRIPPKSNKSNKTDFEGENEDGTEEFVRFW